MGFIFGLAIGITVGFLLHHIVRVSGEPMEPLLPINDYTAQEGDHREQDTH